jgi:hypothetical protein
MLLYRFTRNESLFLGLKLAGFSTIHTIGVLGVMVPTMTGSKIISAQVQEQLQLSRAEYQDFDLQVFVSTFTKKSY